MRQKLGLCCALIHDPALLVLDEPTTGVDPLSRRQFWELTERIREQHPGMSLLAATAYMDEAERFDWLVAMDAGQIIATGTPQDLKAQAGASTLEEAFIAMLPAERRRGRASLVIPKRSPSDEAPVIVARNLTCRFGDFTAVDNVNFSIERGDLWLSWLERMRQDDDDEDAHRTVAGEFRRSAAVWCRQSRQAA